MSGAPLAVRLVVDQSKTEALPLRREPLVPTGMDEHLARLLTQIEARWAGLDDDGHEARREGDEVIVYGPAVRRDPDRAVTAMRCAASDVRSLIGALRARP